MTEPASLIFKNKWIFPKNKGYCLFCGKKFEENDVRKEPVCDYQCRMRYIQNFQETELINILMQFTAKPLKRELWNKIRSKHG